MDTAKRLLSRDPQFLVLGRPVCKKNGIVVGRERGEGQVVSDIDVTDKVEARGAGNLCKFFLAVLIVDPG